MIKIEINCEPLELPEHMKALGYVQPPAAAWSLNPTREGGPEGVSRPDESDMSDMQAAAYSKTEAEIKSYGQMPAAAPGAEILKTTAEMVRANLAANAQPLSPMDGERKRGEPAPGHRRRTNAQIAEDNAYLAQSASLGGVTLSESDSAAVRGTLVTNTSKSTGPEVSSEDAAQDAADEAAETAQRKSDKPTLEDLRAAVGRYTAKVGAVASINSIRDIMGFKCAMIDVPEDGIPLAIRRIEAAIRGEFKEPGNPTDAASAAETGSASLETATAGTAAPAEPAPGTKAEVVAAIMTYGKKYEGGVKPEDLVLTREDMPKILTKLFGDAVKTIPAIPQTPEAYGRARDAIDAATRDNPFNRAVKS
jgi:hypothetical protein